MSKSLKRFARGGFSLVEIMLVLSILGGVAVMEIRRQAAESARVGATAAGRQIAKLGSAVDEYLVTSRGALQRGVDPNCVATATANVCELDLTALRDAGLLPQAWDNATPWGSPYVVRVLRTPAPMPAQAATVCAWNYPGQDRLARGCDPNDASEWSLSALIFSQNAWTAGSQGGAAPLWDSLGLAASEAGPAAAVTRAAVAEGLRGGWRAGAEFGAGLGDGQLAYLAGSSGNSWSKYVRLDGSNKMMGNFDAGGNRIEDMNDMMLLGPESNRRMKRVSSLMPSWVFKGVYQVADGGFVPAPVCPAAGVPKIKLLFQYMADDKAMFYNDTGIPPLTPTAPADLPTANAQLAANAPTYAWRFWADPSGATGWVVHFQQHFLQRDETAGQRMGSGLAEVYCHYEDQQP